MTTPVRNMPRFAADTSPFAPGISLVEASAGTGKTFNIAMSVVRLLLERDANGSPLVQGIGNILVVTFTVAATDELVTRIRNTLRLAYDVFTSGVADGSHATVRLLQRLGDRDPEFARARMVQAMREVDTLAVFTIHGFCKRVLDEFALESGTSFGAALVEDDDALLLAALQDWWRRRFYDDEMLASYAVARRWTPETFRDEYRTWRRFPHVTMVPCPAFDPARAAVTAALHAFATHWDEAAFRQAVAPFTWNSKAPCGTPESLELLVAQANAAAAGDLGAADAVAQSCSVEGLQKFARNHGNEHKARRAAIAGWPVAQAASQLTVALGDFQHALRADCLQQAYAAVQEDKRRRNALGFDDLLSQLSRVLTRQGPDGLLARAIRAQFQAALIDEFQDTDEHQFRIFDTAFAGTPLFVIGDPKQAIYAFRGADVHAYLGAAARASQSFTLDVNYRSTTRMVEAVNRVFSRRRHPFVEPAIHFHDAVADAHTAPTGYALEGTHTLHWLFVSPGMSRGAPAFESVGTAQRMLFAACVTHIKAQLASGCPAREIAVLVRTTREGVEMAEALRQARIPAVVSGLGNVLGSEEMAELQLVLEAVANPRHPARVRAALATHLWGCTHDDLLALVQTNAETEWERVLDELDRLRELWVSRGVLQMLQQLFESRRVSERLLSFADGDRRLTNLRHVVELLHGAASAEELNIESVLRWVATARQRDDREREVAELRLETDEAAVQVMTIHKSKGLQFDVVYCPTLWRAYPVTDKKPVLVHEHDGVVFDLGSPRFAERVARAEVERLAEDCRLAYVALTRARFRTYVGWGPIDGKDKTSASSALTYLLSDQPGLDDLDVQAQPHAVADHFKADPSLWQGVIEEFVRAHHGHMQLEELHTALAVPVGAVPVTPETREYAARELPADIPPAERFDTFRITSFTNLTAGAHGATAGGGSADAARDMDDAPDAPRALAPLTRLDLPRSDFRAFPAGRREGVVLHALFEHSAFDDSAEVLRERVAWHLTRAQLATDETDPRIEATVQMMQQVFTAPLSPWPVTLSAVPRIRTLHEWQFLLPCADASRPLSRFVLANCFERYGGEEGVRYAEQLRQLSVGRLHGFLTGVVDLVFETEGRWYVVDWKSNQLGADPAFYSREALGAVMHSSHYSLQYHLYLVALHRYLTRRLPGYDYDRHIGGAAYAFLRGFDSTSSRTGHGWYTDLPSRALIESLSALMDRSATSQEVA